MQKFYNFKFLKLPIPFIPFEIFYKNFFDIFDSLFLPFLQNCAVTFDFEIDTVLLSISIYFRYCQAIVKKVIQMFFSRATVRKVPISYLSHMFQCISIKKYY